MDPTTQTTANGVPDIRAAGGRERLDSPPPTLIKDENLFGVFSLGLFTHCAVAEESEVTREVVFLARANHVTSVLGFSAFLLGACRNRVGLMETRSRYFLLDIYHVHGDLGWALDWDGRRPRGIFFWTIIYSVLEICFYIFLKSSSIGALL